MTNRVVASKYQYLRAVGARRGDKLSPNLPPQVPGQRFTGKSGHCMRAYAVTVCLTQRSEAAQDPPPFRINLCLLIAALKEYYL